MDWLEKLLSGNWGSTPTPVQDPADFSGISVRGGRTHSGELYDTLPSVVGNSTSGNGGLFSNGEGFLGTMLSSKDANGIEKQGWGELALGLGQGLFQGYNGMKQFGLAEDQFKESQRQYNQNYAAQVKSVNTQLEDRQRARVASNPNAYESVSTYLEKNRMK